MRWSNPLIWVIRLQDKASFDAENDFIKKNDVAFQLIAQIGQRKIQKPPKNKTGGKWNHTQLSCIEKSHWNLGVFWEIPWKLPLLLQWCQFFVILIFQGRVNKLLLHVISVHFTSSESMNYMPIERFCNTKCLDAERQTKPKKKHI